MKLKTNLKIWVSKALYASNETLCWDPYKRHLTGQLFGGRPFILAIQKLDRLADRPNDRKKPSVSQSNMNFLPLQVVILAAYLKSKSQKLKNIPLYRHLENFLKEDSKNFQKKNFELKISKNIVHVKIKKQGFILHSSEDLIEFCLNVSFLVLYLILD
ncbi:hypothetical protein BpHYR1_053462 [Brachionus plicatilis]|uniref:Uncharacterized protein n=1 Tax=Brachionus plicatilis TaxID=10195 RepID=A0A3M7QRI3_BRAPC|nr:hypothetical protein BpHYR1_053462 [Brachionus plicatilis]